MSSKIRTYEDYLQEEINLCQENCNITDIDPNGIFMYIIKRIAYARFESQERLRKDPYLYYHQNKEIQIPEK